MQSPQREAILADLALLLQQRRLDGAARFMLDVIEPVGVIASQAMLLVRPFSPRGRWRDYVDALSDESGWQSLHNRLTER